MTRIEKIKKAAAIAVAYYLEQQKLQCASTGDCNSRKSWVNTSKAIQMRGRMIMQQRGRVASVRNVGRRDETAPAQN